MKALVIFAVMIFINTQAQAGTLSRITQGAVKTGARSHVLDAHDFSRYVQDGLNEARRASDEGSRINATVMNRAFSNGSIKVSTRVTPSLDGGELLYLVKIQVKGLTKQQEARLASTSSAFDFYKSQYGTTTVQVNLTSGVFDLTTLEGKKIFNDNLAKLSTGLSEAYSNLLSVHHRGQNIILSKHTRPSFHPAAAR